MPIENRIRIYRLAENLKMKFRHFAKGTYACSSPSRFTVNRLILILENPNGKENFIEDSCERHIMRPGFFYLAPAFHNVRFRFDEKVRFFSIHFNLELFQGIDLFSREHRIFEKNVPEYLERAETAFSGRRELSAAAKLHALTFDIASQCIESMNEESLVLVTKFAPYQKVIDYIAAHCTAFVTVEELAEVMNMRRDVFTRKFTADTGISPKQFFNRFLIDKASEMLREPHISAREVAFALNFSSEYYFSRFFKQHLGIPPHQFQEQYRIRP